MPHRYNPTVSSSLDFDSIPQLRRFLNCGKMGDEFLHLEGLPVEALESVVYSLGEIITTEGAEGTSFPITSGRRITGIVGANIFEENQSLGIFQIKESMFSSIAELQQHLLEIAHYKGD